MGRNPKILAAVGVVIVLLATLQIAYRSNYPEKLASLIRGGDAAGVSQLIMSHLKLVNTDIDSKVRLKPLHLGASRGQETICINLIAAGADINAQDLAGETPLYFALAAPDSNVLVILLQHGASVSLADIKGNTPLYYAVISDDKKAVSMLLQYGADPSRKNKVGKSPLDYANESTNKDVITMILEAIPNPNGNK